MNPPNWTAWLLGFALLALGGFVLVIFSGFWHLVAIIVFCLLALRFYKPSRDKGDS